MQVGTNAVCHRTYHNNLAQHTRMDGAMASLKVLPGSWDLLLPAALLRPCSDTELVGLLCCCCWCPLAGLLDLMDTGTASELSPV